MLTMQETAPIRTRQTTTRSPHTSALCTGRRLLSRALVATLLLPVLEIGTGARENAAAAAERNWTSARSKAAIEKALERARKRTIRRAAALKSNAVSKAGDNLAKAADHADAIAKDAIPSPAANPARGEKPLSPAERKAAVLAAPPDVLKRIGRHVISGFYSPETIKPLLERGAIGGVFVTARNAHRQNKSRLATELAQLRKVATEAGQANFWIATDQEGGSVSRLSPPLPYQVSLPRLIRELKTPEARQQAVTAYAEKQASNLASLGINLNFAPVADLNHNVRSDTDRFTKIRYRAIAADPATVTEVARTYCDALAEARVYCTLKHFPGLGRVHGDTHITSAQLKASANELEKTDWVPFREVLTSTPAFVMISHAHVTSIDPDRPASTSEKVVQEVLRDKWKYDGIVITDDLVMGAITRRYKGGIGAAALDALNAGNDIVLIGNDGDQIYEVLYALMRADEQGRLAPGKLAASAERLATAAKALGPSPTEKAETPTSTDAPDTKTARQ